MVKCPCCNGEIILSDYDANIRGDLDLTDENIKYPNHFHLCKNAKSVDDKRINEWIQQGLKFFKEYGESVGDFYITECGDTTVVILKMDGDEEYKIYVAKNVAESYIPYSNVDF